MLSSCTPPHSNQQVLLMAVPMVLSSYPKLSLYAGGNARCVTRVADGISESSTSRNSGHAHIILDCACSLSPLPLVWSCALGYSPVGTVLTLQLPPYCCWNDWIGAGGDYVRSHTVIQLLLASKAVNQDALSPWPRPQYCHHIPGRGGPGMGCTHFSSC